jgi:hypothetical protein
MIDCGWLRVLHVDRNITLATTVDLATGRCHAYPIRHFFLGEFRVQFIHQRLDDARGIGARYVTVQPSLGVGNHRH